MVSQESAAHSSMPPVVPTLPPAVNKLVKAAQFAKSELKAWMRNHGQDLDTAAAISDIDEAISELQADALQAARTSNSIAAQVEHSGAA